ncbi:TonB-dependent receptor [Ramlibacter sp.]|uniref:TonB-dependent receptor n=1 Tax=Ramlibacter sp. TaxID=1917967 RepID=UPI002B764B2E|nr:TonB-dependent receptor [Ramlibacter sp.]HWI82226.1 TonB-dependent receptor [Ramlibacter sp.]
MNKDRHKFRHTVIFRALIAATCGTASMMMAHQAMAQQSSSSLGRVEITGSNIKRTDAETASPVQVITKQEIDQSGKGTVAEYLQTLTADAQGSVPFTYGRGFSGATSSGISLRGLGANATLVLINGRRVSSAVLADDAQRTYVDLNQIPLEAVERVEVLKDGASSIYGSDAVAGVVNIILKKNFVGTVVKATYGVSQEGDGNEPRIAITHGMGDLDKNGWNLLLNAEFGKKDPIYYRDRDGRGPVGVSAIGQGWGFNPNTGPTNNIPRAGGNGWIPTANNAAGRINNSAAPSFIGNVRNPSTLNYYSRGDAAGVGFTRTFPGAQAYCNANANLPQNNPAGGCLSDVWRQVGQIQPEHQTSNFFGRFTKQINANMEAFAEVGYYTSESRVTGLPLAPSGGFFTPEGNVISRTAVAQLGATHPDNPYFGTAARLQYNPVFDLGPGVVSSKSHSTRLVAGLKGTVAAWDYDTAIHYSEAKQTDTSENRINWRVADALLNPTAANVAAARAFSPAYAALPAGTFWRIGENASLNSPEMYRALLQNQERSGFSRTYGADLKVSRELGKLDGGPIGVAFGLEARHEANSLPLYTGLGNFIGLSLTTYSGDRNIVATYGEVLLPVTKKLELNGALRYDRYSDAGNSVTPKIGAKFKALPNLALRGTFAEGFRAPSSTENSASSMAAFGGATVDDNARCAAGVPDALCKGVAPTFVQRGNPSLEPEKSKSWTLGAVWDITPKTSLTVDAWQIKRRGLPVIEDPQAAVDAGRVTRDPATAVTPGDPGAILSGFVVFQNSAESLTRGIDLEARHRWDLGNGYGRFTTGLTWTHLLTQRVTEASGTVHDYAGTHGDCNITNCIGSPRDRIQLTGTWEMGAWRLGANVNYRGSMSNKFEKADTSCAQTLADGTDFPGGCKVKAFTTLDLSAAWKFRQNTEIFGSIQNVFDNKPPADFETYGAIGYNPLDYSGAIGRFFRIGIRHKF